jgi:hypothetical protein
MTTLQLSLMKARQFQPGFRLSMFDVIILITGAGACVYALTIEQNFAIAIAFVILHFFLFCNVLRMSRRLELAWASIFAGMAIMHISFELLSWPLVFAISLAATCAVALIEIRHPSYHGIGWKWLNARLPEWWQATTVCQSKE